MDVFVNMCRMLFSFLGDSTALALFYADRRVLRNPAQTVSIWPLHSTDTQHQSCEATVCCCVAVSVSPCVWGVCTAGFLRLLLTSSKNMFDSEGLHLGLK